MQLRVHLMELKKNMEDRIYRLEEKIKLLEKRIESRTKDSAF